MAIRRRHISRLALLEYRRDSFRASSPRVRREAKRERYSVVEQGDYRQKMVPNFPYLPVSETKTL